MKQGEIRIHVPFSKVDEDQRMVFGYATTGALDSQGEVVSKEAIRQAWDDYMKFANVREMHQPSAVGVTKEFQHDEKGTWIGVKVVDDRAWKFVKEQVYKGFSIGGRIVEKVDNVIKTLVLSEISLVDRPANPEAIFEVVKMDDSAVNALATLSKENRLMDLTLITQKDPSTLTDEEKTHLRENQEELSDEQKEHFADALNEEPAEEGAEGTEEGTEEGTDEEGVEGDVEEPAEEGAGEEEGTEEEATPEGGAEAPAEEGGEQVVPEGEEQAEPAPEGSGEEVLASAQSVDTKKDARGVIGLSDMLAHLEYVIEYFKSDGRQTKNLEAARSDILKAVEEEARQKMTTPDGFSKMMTDTFKQVLKDSGLDKVASEVADLQKKVQGIEKKRVAKRPTVANAVEKGFGKDGDGVEKSVPKLQEELAGIQKEIDNFAVKAKGVTDSEKRAQLMQESDELFAKFRSKQSEIQQALAQGNF